MNNEKSFSNSNYHSLKCIWMASQVVEYKLCDNGFDCEQCEFDKVMTNLLSKKQNEVNDISTITNVITQNLRSIKFDDQIIYLKNNLIIKEICPNTFYLGINPIFISFLDNIELITITECKKNIVSGQEIIRISGEWGSVSIPAPMDLVLHDIPGDPTKDIFNSRWLALIGASDLEIVKGRLYQSDWEKLHSNAISIIEEIKSHIPHVGDTMMDGGTQIKSLHQLIGKSKYLKILNSLTSL